MCAFSVVQRSVFFSFGFGLRFENHLIIPFYVWKLEMQSGSVNFISGSIVQAVKPKYST